jgi:hypothetical protein
MNLSQSQGHHDHIDWVPSLSEYDIGQSCSQLQTRLSKPTTIPQKLIDSVDWSMYLDDTEPTDVRGDASICEEAKAQPTEVFKTATYAALLFRSPAKNADTPV